MVAEPSEDCNAMVHNLPIFRDQDFDASEDGIRVQNRLPNLDLGVPQVDFAGPEEREALCATEIPC